MEIITIYWQFNYYNIASNTFNFIKCCKQIGNSNMLKYVHSNCNIEATGLKQT